MKLKRTYEVERVGRMVTLVLVEAYNAQDARERVLAGEGEEVEGHSEAGGVSKVRRA